MKKIIFSILALFVIQFTEAQQLIGVLGLIADQSITSIGQGNVEVNVYGVFKFETNGAECFQGYELLKKKENLTPTVLENNRGISIQDAVNRVISSVRCGEFLMNAEIYSYDNAYVVVGDVYGKKIASCFFQVGDNVSWGRDNVGVIVSFDDDECVVKKSYTNKLKKVDFDELVLINSEENKFSIGDKVSWKVSGGNYKTGIIVATKNEFSCLVRESDTDKQKEMRYKDLFLIND